jgi:formate-dependent nitrite reductase membrane component NrfD
VQAIVAGDLDDPGSSIARLVASQPVQVRKPEQGTEPKVFYLGADEAALTPAMQSHVDQYVFSQRASIPVPGQPGRPAALIGEKGNGLEPISPALARAVYDVAHPERPWGGKVAAYLWAKAVAAGALLIAGAGMLTGAASGNVLAGLIAPILAIAFLVLTTALLIGDLKRPERFWFLLLKPNWRSWLVWGGWILMAFGAVAALWLLLGLTGHGRALRLLAVPAMALAAAAAGYSAFLFGQAEGRDFWQSPLLLPHLLVAALAAGSAGLLLASTPLGLATAAPRGLRLVLFAALASGAVVLLAELVGLHATQDARRAAHVLSRGALSRRFWAGAMGAGTLLPMALLLTPWPPAWALAACCALAGLWLYEDLWMRAGQSIPLS